jgi:hypothetical protein
MDSVTLDELRLFVNQLDDRRFTTRAHQRRFSIEVVEKGIEYTPESSGKPRLQRWSWIERVLDRFNDTGALQPSEYRDLTVHASYILSILSSLLDSRTADNRHSRIDKLS